MTRPDVKIGTRYKEGTVVRVSDAGVYLGRPASSPNESCPPNSEEFFKDDDSLRCFMHKESAPHPVGILHADTADKQEK